MPFLSQLLHIVTMIESSKCFKQGGRPPVQFRLMSPPGYEKYLLELFIALPSFLLIVHLFLHFILKQLL